MSPLKPVTIRVRRGLLILAIAAVPALPVAAWLVASQVSDNADLTQQIQDLVCSAHRDKVKRLENTRTYLATPLGRERSGSTGGLNAYIARVSLPQLEKEVAQERTHLPASCRSE